MRSFGQWLAAGGPGSEAEDLSLPESARAFQGERAGFTTRFLACAVDVAVVAVVMFGVWATLAILQLIFTPGVELDPPGIGTLVLLGYLFMTVYWALSWRTSGRSIGAWVLGVRVVGPRGNRLGFPYALLRAAFCVGFPPGLVWALVSKRNRSVQDVVLRSIVIYDWALRPPIIMGGNRQAEGPPKAERSG